MRTIMGWTVGAAVLFGAACSSGGKEQATGVPDDLQRDLAAASAASVPLASRNFQPQQIVSAIESPVGAAPRRATRTPRPVPRQVAANEPAEQRSPDVQSEAMQESAPAPESSAETPAPELDIAPVSTAARPSAQPISMPGGGETGSGDRGMGVGETIGVIIGTAVIRGGMGGIDHCDPRTDRTRGTRTPRGGSRPDYTGNLPLPTRGGVAINDRIRDRGIRIRGVR